jgi:hypothetical protein
MISQQPKFQINNDMFTVNSNRFAGDAITVEPTKMTVFSNQALAGDAHPRTKIQPIIPAPAYDYGFWHKGGQRSIVNSRKREYPKQMGLSRRDFLNVPQEQCPPVNHPSASSMYNPLAETLQPGVYTIPSEFQPINHNLGISTTPHFNKEFEIDVNKNVLFAPIHVPDDIKEGFAYPESRKERSGTLESAQPADETTEETPLRRRVPAVPKFDAIDTSPNVYNVFDPRFNSYGPSNRCYIDPTVQQPRWCYDDVDSIRMPKYIVRSKIDSCLTPVGDQIGTLNTSHLTLSEVKREVERNYLENNLNHRNDLMESLMRKRNAELWQLRQSPMNTYPQPL